VIVVQSMSGGRISKNCAKCNKRNNFSGKDWLDLQICVMCPDCGSQAKPEMLGINYGYLCQCGWACELAALVAHYSDNET
jgi:hypothetical protein